MSRLVSRRGVLGAGLAVPVVAGCQRGGHAPSEPPVPGAAALDSALADENRLIAAYDAAIARQSASPATLHRLRADHVAHRAALVAAGARPAGSPTPTATTTAAGPQQGHTQGRSDLGEIADAERAAAVARTTACLAAPRSLAPLFGSLAASEAAHAVALRA